MPCDEALLWVITIEDEHVMKAFPQVKTIDDEQETAVDSGGQGENLGAVEDVDTQILRKSIGWRIEGYIYITKKNNNSLPCLGLL